MLPYDNSMLTKDWTECSRPLTTDSEHVLGGLVDLDEDSVVDLPQSEQLKNLLDLGGHLVDTTDPHDKDKLGLSGDIVVSLLLGITLQPNENKLRSLFGGMCPKAQINKIEDNCFQHVLCLMMEQ